MLPASFAHISIFGTQASLHFPFGNVILTNYCLEDKCMSAIWYVSLIFIVIHSVFFYRQGLVRCSGLGLCRTVSSCKGPASSAGSSQAHVLLACCKDHSCYTKHKRVRNSAGALTVCHKGALNQHKCVFTLLSHSKGSLFKALNMGKLWYFATYSIISIVPN